MNIFPPASYIEKIEIDGLFGHEDIRLDTTSTTDPRIAVIYGRNGSGKTTILNVVRSLLSCDEGGGHRTRLSKVPFKRAAVHLSGGVIVEARKKSNLTGNFEWTFERAKERVSVTLQARDGVVRIRPGEVAYDNILSITTELRSVIPKLIYLDDKRTFHSALDSDGDTRVLTRRMPDGSVVRTRVSAESDDFDPVRVVLNEVADLIRKEALALSNRGNQNAQTIYSNLVKGLIGFPDSESDSTVEIRGKLKDLEGRSTSISQYGLSSPVDHSEMISMLEGLDKKFEPVVHAALSPYVESLSARISAIEGLYSRVDTWLGHINNFIYPKHIKFNVGDGVSVFSKAGDLLSVSDLSSGERHLLVLMTKAMTLRATGGLMIIDEPEISLNTSWQRSLIRGILDNFDGGPCQLLIASHSLEICSQYVGSLVEV